MSEYDSVQRHMTQLMREFYVQTVWDCVKQIRYRQSLDHMYNEEPGDKYEALIESILDHFEVQDYEELTS